MNKNESHICSYLEDNSKPNNYICECGRRITIDPFGDLQVDMPGGFSLEDLPEGFSVNFVGESMTFTQLELEDGLKAAEECLSFWQGEVVRYKRLLGLKEPHQEEWADMIDTEDDDD